MVKKAALKGVAKKGFAPPKMNMKKGGPTSANEKAVGRNIARANNQRGK